MKENKKKGGISRLLELAGEKKTLVVWCCILSALSVFFELVPFLAVYQVLGELLKHAADLSQANAKFMLSWAGYGIIGLLIGYALMYVGGMLGHTAAYRTLYGWQNTSGGCPWGGSTAMPSARSSRSPSRMWSRSRYSSPISFRTWSTRLCCCL